METFKNWSIVILITIVIFCLLHKCNSSEKQHIQHNRIIEYIDKEIIKEVNNVKKEDSLRSELSKVTSKYKHLLKYPKNIYHNDTLVMDSIVYLAKQQDVLISVDSSEINRLKNIINLQAKKDTARVKYIDSLLTAPNKYWKGFRDGFITGNVTGGLFIGVVK